MSFALIAALAENDVIGHAGGLPWHLPDDLRHFKRLTRGHTLLMGRKTFESLGGRPLPQRRHLILSRDPEFRPREVEVFADLETALRATSEAELIFAAGGAPIFAATLPLVRELFLTRIHARPKGDTFFPPLDLTPFERLSSELHPSDERHEHAFTFEHYRRQ
jgi:dihydrofolate reductase